MSLIDDGGSMNDFADDVTVDSSSMDDNDDDKDVKLGTPLQGSTRGDVDPKTSTDIDTHGLTSTRIHKHASSADMEKTLQRHRQRHRQTSTRSQRQPP